MWRFLISLLMGVVVGSANSHAADQFPAVGYAVVEHASVRSGPGDEYYVTERIAHGTQLEVHRRELGGWLAIRPLASSFSWVSSAKLFTANRDGIAEVITDDAFSWVGSGIEDVMEHKWQVKLKRGERVAVLGEKQVFNATSGVTEAWTKISPPSGEFRWIHEQMVTWDRPSSVSTGVARAGAAPNWKTPTGSKVQQVAFQEEVNDGRATIEQVGGRVRIPAAMRDEPRGREDVASLVRPDDLRPLERKTRAGSSLDGKSGSVEETFADLEAQLALMVAREPNYWHLDRIREQTEQLIAQGATPVERGRARLFLEKIDQFDDLRRRHIQVERAVALPATNIGGTSAGAGTDRDSLAIQPRFDGSGWLVPVHSTKRLAPPFAILDENGKVQQYVSPAPGLNLHRYVRKRVGVYGQKSSVASLNAPHLTAHQVVDMDRHTR